MTTTVHVPAPIGRVGLLSILSASLTALFAAFTHSYVFGPPAFLAGAIVIALIAALGFGYQRGGRRILLLPYALINLWIIVAFGIVGGFWDHAVRAVLCVLHGGVVPPSLEPWFTSPDLGSAVLETAWIMTFLASLAAAVFGYRFIHSKPSGQGPLP
jgi:hypothetical protein